MSRSSNFSSIPKPIYGNKSAKADIVLESGSKKYGISVKMRGDYVVVSAQNKEEFEGRNTCVICRAGAIDDSAGLALMAAFEVAGSFMINTREAMLTADNKLSTTILFEQFGIPQPKTAFVSNEKQIEREI